MLLTVTSSTVLELVLLLSHDDIVSRLEYGNRDSVYALPQCLSGGRFKY